MMKVASVEKHSFLITTSVSKHWKMALCWHLKDQRLCSDARGQLIHWPDNTQHMKNTAACPQPQLSAKPCHMNTLSVVSGLWLTKCTAFTCKLLTDAFIHGDLQYMNRTHDHYYLCSKKKKLYIFIELKCCDVIHQAKIINSPIT